MGNVRVAAGLSGAVMGLLVALALCAGQAPDLAAAAQRPARSVGVPVPAARSAVVNMAALARQDAARPAPRGQSLVQVAPKLPAPPAPRASAPPFLRQFLPPQAGVWPQVPSPSPAQDFAGLDDIRNLSTGYSYIPPDTDGAVGLTKVMSGLNNNYRIWTKATGDVVSTVGTSSFWGLSNSDSYVFDPRTLYDPINDRWIVVMLQAAGADTSSFIDIGVSQTSDPSGAYYLFSFDVDPEDLLWADFPTVGFNKDYIAVNVNMYDTTTWESHTSNVLAVDYRALRAGTWRGWFLDGSGFTSSPAATYSATESTLYVPTQIDAALGSYRVDTITGDPWTGPVYTVGATRSRGLTWTAPLGNILPQKPTTAVRRPTGIETADDMIGSTPVVRDGFIYYTQTVGLPAGGAMTHTSVLWTKLTASTGAVADGGLIDDPTATATNGGKWYSYPHIAVNKYGDAIVGFSQFSSAQWASSGYAVRAASDPAGTMRDPVVYKAGEDLYQKDYGSGRNRWGDYSKAQVDPSNDTDLWVLNEYAKPIGTNLYGGVWGTWWGRVTALSGPLNVTGFTPAFGPEGTVVTITGTGFSGVTEVAFGGAAARTYAVVSATQITATVPRGATTGRISLSTRRDRAVSAEVFTVTAPGPSPTVTGFTPAFGPVGTVVTITGTGFSGATAVAFDGFAARAYAVVSDTQIIAIVPREAATGAISVTTPGGSGAGAASFIVTFMPRVTPTS